MGLENFFAKNRKFALAFSGGTDSAYLLYAGILYGADVLPYFVKSQFQPVFEFENARRLAEQLKVNLRVLENDVLSDSRIVSNSANRCYFCKKRIFELLISAAVKDGYPIVADGTNADDCFDDRPGMMALSELGICSPLREAGLCKAEIRSLSKKAGLLTWNMPSYSCLATRVKPNVVLSEKLLRRVEISENVLRNLGYEDFRIRTDGKTACVVVSQKQLERAFAEEDKIVSAVAVYFNTVLLDREGR